MNQNTQQTAVNHQPQPGEVVFPIADDVILKLSRTLPISLYCQLYKEKVSCIDKRIQRGYWAIGVQVTKPAGSKERYIDLDEVDRWARNTRAE